MSTQARSALVLARIARTLEDEATHVYAASLERFEPLVSHDSHVAAWHMAAMERRESAERRLAMIEGGAK